MNVSIFYSYIRLFVFLGCTLVGIQVPVFVDEYGKSLESHLAESRMALNEFQGDADKYFDGRLEKLIAHYLNNGDQVFNEGGRSIESIYNRNLMLKMNFAQFQSSAWAAYTQALFTPVPDVGSKAWKNHSYAIQLKPSAIAFGLIVGLIFSLGVELLLRLACQFPKLFNSKAKAPSSPAR